MSLTDKLSGGLTPDCPLALAGFRSYSLAKVTPEISGSAVSMDAAIRDASRILKKAHNPLIYISGEISCEEQAAAIAFGKLYKSMVDTGASTGGCALPLAIQQTGYQCASLADLRKAECILAWASDTLTRHPRLLSSWREINCQATTLKVINEDNSSSFSAYFHAKRWQVHSKNITISHLFDLPKRIQTGIYLINQNIIDQGKIAVSELFSLMDEIGENSSWKGLHLAPGGNSRGAAETLQSIAGYPACLCFSQDAVEFSPPDYAIDSVLKNRECDLIIFMGYPHELSKEMITHLHNQDTILISATKPKWIPKVQIPVRRPGIDIDGTVLRMDGVAFQMKQVVESDRPDLLTILGSLSGVTSV